MSLCYNILDLLERGVRMNHNLLLYIFYGLVSGFSEFTPLSQSAHQALFPMVLNFDSTWPLLRFFVHLGALGGLVFLNWQKLNHFYHEIKMFSVSPRYRKRPSDVGAVLDVRLVIMAFVPMMIGAVLAGATEEQVQTVEAIAADVGLAFQIQDDILDVVSTAEVLGKPVLSDEKNEKTTYVTLEGLEKAKADVKMISDRACDTLMGLPGEKEFLSQLIEMLVHREN